MRTLRKAVEKGIYHQSKPLFIYTCTLLTAHDATGTPDTQEVDFGAGLAVTELFSRATRPTIG